MNGRNIERVLDAWLVDGPSVMPDRLFDAVLDRVERTPQRRLARLHPRLTEMTPRTRLYAAAAAAVVVAIAGIYLLNRSSGPSAGASPSLTIPSPTSSVWALPTNPGAGPVQSSLTGRWMSGPGTIAGMEDEVGISLLLTDDSFSISPANDDLSLHLQSNAWSIDGTQLNLDLIAGTDGCAVDDRAKYGVRLSPSGRTLTFELEEEVCAARSAALSGTFWKMGCPTPGDNCLGLLDAGIYGSQFIDPFVAYGAKWNARFGAVQYRVPPGWQNIEDWPTFFRLGTEGGAEGTFIFLATDIVAVSDREQCTDTIDPEIGTTAEELANWVATSSGLVTTAPVPVTIGGLQGFRVDIGLDPTWTETCPWSDAKPVRELFADRNPGEGFGMGIQGDTRMALHFLDVGGDRAILIDVEASTGAAFDTFRDDAITVVDSFVFNR